MKLNRLLPLALLFALPSVSFADTVDDAVEAANAAPRNRLLQREAGDALKDAGRYREAITYYLQSDNAGNLGAAEAAFYLYDFAKASEYLDRYLARRTKSEAAGDMDFSYRPDDDPMDWTDYLASRIELGASMLDRVERVQIIDSINVPADRFFEFVRLARSAGRLTGEDVVTKIVGSSGLSDMGLADVSAPAYVTESGDEVVWTGADANGNARIYESVRLADGSWDNPVPLFDYASIFGTTEGQWLTSPFLMNDGVTLYFGADGGESLGGLDIFITRRDDDGFLQPSNIGMPYNSPFNDYLYAIDEETGTGWWVSDRNRLTDSVTVYTFIPSEIRVNYPVDTPDLASYARVASIAATLDPGADHSRLLRRIASADFGASDARTVDEFEFSLPDGHIVRRVSDLRSNLARNAMVEYRKALANHDAAVRKLESLRADYAAGNHSVADEILRLEAACEKDRTLLLDLSNSVVNAEM